MADEDDDLLARLNKLKTSSVSLDTKSRINHVSNASTQLKAQPEASSELSDRFARLLAQRRVQNQELQAHSPDDDTESRHRSHNDDPELNVKPYRDGKAEETAEELLAELRAMDSSRDQATEVKDLLAQARDLLPHESKANDEALPSQFKDVDIEIEASGQHTERHDADSRSKSDEEEQADEYIARVLDELDAEQSTDIAAVESQTDQRRQAKAEGSTSLTDVNDLNTNESMLDLPSTPSIIRTDAPVESKDDRSIDDVLAARFSSLGVSSISLPAAPSFAPLQKPTRVVGSIKGASLTEAYTDADIDSWCCICTEDASVKCLGCEGDLYCADCWKNGHGSGAGQEKGHRAVEYRRDQGVAA